MGVLNVTPDSFSDGGLYLSPEAAITRASTLIKQGADVIDIGAQSTRPGADEVGPEEELKRLIPILCSIRKKHPEVIISIDTFHSSVAKKTLEHGANWINDVSGGRHDPNILNVVSTYDCPYVLTHSRGNSRSMDSLVLYKNVTLDVINELSRSTEIAISKGINPLNIIWDPGIGFAKKTNQNLELIQNLKLLRSKGFAVLVGPSRKRFIGELLNEPDPNKRLLGTIAIACHCSQSKVEMVRVHDVKEISTVLTISNKIYN